MGGGDRGVSGSQSYPAGRCLPRSHHSVSLIAGGTFSPPAYLSVPCASAHPADSCSGSSSAMPCPLGSLTPDPSAGFWAGAVAAVRPSLGLSWGCSPGSEARSPAASSSSSSSSASSSSAGPPGKKLRAATALRPQPRQAAKRSRRSSAWRVLKRGRQAQAGGGRTWPARSPQRCGWPAGRVEGPRPAGRPRPSADPGLRGSALAGEEAVTKDEEGETEETGSRRKVATGNHQVFSRLVAARWGCRGRPGNALRGVLLSLRRLMEPSSLSLGSAAAAATAVPGLAQHSPASSSLHSSAPPVLPASRTPSPRPLPAQDARGHLFTASASDSPVHASPQRRPGDAGGLNSWARYLWRPLLPS